MQGSGMFITCLCIYREVRYGHNPYLFFAKQKGDVCDVVMYIFA
jgi:hypothetical protein